MTLKHFKLAEFACPCCGLNQMDGAFLQKLDAARDWAGVPFRVTSAMRCPAHNAEVGGEPNSRHLTGGAVDLAFTDRRMLSRIIQGCLRVGITSMAASKAGSFLHVDSFPGDWFGLY